MLYTYINVYLAGWPDRTKNLMRAYEATATAAHMTKVREPWAILAPIYIYDCTVKSVNIV